MSLWSQYFPPKPTLTEANLPSQADKVFLITGGASGIGYELAATLYAAGAKVYIAGRSERNGQEAISKIQSATSTVTSHGTLSFLYLDLSDLGTIVASADTFLQREPRLDVLWNNAGIGATFNGETSAQGLPIQWTTNCIGPYLLTQLLQPALQRSSSPRVVWSGSAVVDSSAPHGGMLEPDFETPKKTHGVYNYTASKVGNWFLASEFARRERARAHAKADPGSSPVLHVAVNPGNLRTQVWRTFSWLFVAILSATLLYDAKYGAYSALWAGVSPELDIEVDNGAYLLPWGRKQMTPRADIVQSLKTEEEGGTGMAAKFFYWCERQAAPFR